MANCGCHGEQVATECSCIQQVFEALSTRKSVDPEVAAIEGCDSPQPMLLGNPEQRSVSQIHRQIAVLPHPARHQFQGRSTQLRTIQAIERHPGKYAWCYVGRDQMANLGENRPSGYKSTVVLMKKAAQMPWFWSLRSNQVTNGWWCRFLGPHWKSCRSARGLPPGPPGWWSAVATSQGQP